MAASGVWKASMVRSGREEVYVAAMPLRAKKGPPQLLMSAAYSLNFWNFHHFMVIINNRTDPCSFQLLVYDFQPKDPEDPYAALAVLSGRSVPGAVLVRKLKKLPRNKCWLVGYSKEDAEKVATEFNKTWETSLRVGVNDCRHYTNGGKANPCMHAFHTHTYIHTYIMGAATVAIPEVVLESSNGQRRIPVIGLGTAPEASSKVSTKDAVVEAIKQGYRHFDAASAYGVEQSVGEAIQEALQLGLISSRDQLFITTKIWVTDNHPHLILPALQKSLKTLQLDYLDLYLIHWPISAKPGKVTYPIEQSELVPFDMEGVWKSMEECQRLGLTKAIGVSNFSIKKLQKLLSFATIPPAVNQVEVNLAFQQHKLREFCKSKGITVTAFSPLRKGSSRGTNMVMDNDVLKELADAHAKTVAQICLRWIYEQGLTVVAKSYDKERMKQNLEIFDWCLTDEDYKKISEIHQDRLIKGPTKPLLHDLWDEEDEHQ